MKQTIPQGRPGGYKKAFGPQRKHTPRILGRNIALSILAHRDAGRMRLISQYTRNEDTIRWIRHYLRELAHPVESDEQRALRVEQQAWLERCQSGIRGERGYES